MPRRANSAGGLLLPVRWWCRDGIHLLARTRTIAAAAAVVLGCVGRLGGCSGRVTCRCSWWVVVGECAGRDGGGQAG
jgi:hypothetical protein